MAMVALNVLSLLFVHGALPKKSSVWAFSFYFNNVTLRFRKLFCYWSQILNLGSNSDTFTNERNVVGYERGGEGEGEGGVRSTITLPDGEYDNQYVHHSETWRLLHLNEGLETICGSTPLDARTLSRSVRTMNSMSSVLALWLPSNYLSRSTREVTSWCYFHRLPGTPPPSRYSNRPGLLFSVFYVYEWYLLSCFFFSLIIWILRLVTPLLALLYFLIESF